MKSKTKYIIPIILILLTLLVTLFIVKKYRNPMQMSVLDNGKPMDMVSMGGQVGTIPVATDKVERGTIDATIKYTGTVVPYTEQDIYPRVTGRIVTMPVYPGDEVKPGQLLVKLDTAELSSKVNETKSNMVAAEFEVGKAEKELEAAKARVASHEHEIETVSADYDYWKSEIEREEKLYKNGAVSKDEYEMELSKYKSAKSNLELHHDMHEESTQMQLAAELNLKKTQAMLQQTKAGQKTAEIIRDYSTIVSPIHGYVSERAISPGVLVEPGIMILKVVEMDKVRVQANIPSSELQGIKKGNLVTIVSRKNQNETQNAKITSIFPSADPTSRTVVVEAIVDNKGDHLLPGDFVTVQVSGDHKEDVLLVPTSSIIRLDNENSSAVWVTGDESSSDTTAFYYTCTMHPQIHLDKPGKCPICGMTLVKKMEKNTSMGTGNNTAHLKKVTIGISDSNNTGILEGLEEGETIIVAGYETLQEGDKVYPTEWTKTGPKELPPPPELKNMPGMSHGTAKSNNESMDNMPGMKH